MHRKLLATFLGCDSDELIPCDWFIESAYNYKGIDYFIFTESEADKEARKHVLSYMGTFDPEFILKHLKVEVDVARLKSIIQRNGENCAEMLVLFLKNEEDFLNDAVRIYGRPYFICFGDRTEYTVEEAGEIFYIYRLAND